MSERKHKMIIGPFFLLEYELIFRFQQRHPSIIFYYHFLRKRICFRLKKYCYFILVSSTQSQCRSVFLFALNKRRKKTQVNPSHRNNAVLSKNPPEYHLRKQKCPRIITTTRKPPKLLAAPF